MRESPDSYSEWAIIGAVAAWLAWRQRGFFAALTRPRRVVAFAVFFWRGRQRWFATTPSAPPAPRARRRQAPVAAAIVAIAIVALAAVVIALF